MSDDPIRDIAVAAYTVPTEHPESDGTLAWTSTTVVVVRISAGGHTGLGWSYTSAATGHVIAETLAPVLVGSTAGDIPYLWRAMHRACRNLGTKGLIMHAISAVDIALWDLAGHAAGSAAADLLGRCALDVPAYGSGGFTSMTDAQLDDQVADWKAAGCASMKIKIGQDWGSSVERDLARVGRLRDLAGSEVQLMADANGGYTAGQARRVGAELDDIGVVWFEEPVSSDDLQGLASVRVAVRCDVAAGEYIADSYDAQAMCGAVDCLQLDATRCGGYTGWRACAAVAAARNLQVSAHCGAALHAHVAASAPNLRHVEWFADHARVDALLFDGVPPVAGGRLPASRAAHGHGMTLRPESSRWRVS